MKCVDYLGEISIFRILSSLIHEHMCLYFSQLFFLFAEHCFIIFSTQMFNQSAVVQCVKLLFGRPASPIRVPELESHLCFLPVGGLVGVPDSCPHPISTHFQMLPCITYITAAGRFSTLGSPCLTPQFGKTLLKLCHVTVLIIGG